MGTHFRFLLAWEIAHAGGSSHLHWIEPLVPGVAGAARSGVDVYHLSGIHLEI